MSHAGKAIKAKRGDHMIEIKVKFFTDGIDQKKRKDYIVPKHGWINGTVQVDRNEAHGIVPDEAEHFNSLMEIPLAIEKVLIKNEIKLHRARRLDDYLVVDA